MPTRETTGSARPNHGIGPGTVSGSHRTHGAPGPGQGGAASRVAAGVAVALARTVCVTAFGNHHSQAVLGHVPLEY